MSASRNIQMLTRYTAWANTQLFDALAELYRQAGAAEYCTARANILRTLNHANVIDQIWRAHLEGKPHGFTSRNTEDIPPLEELRLTQCRQDDWYIRYADTLPEERHDELIHFQFIGGEDGIMSRGDILLHVVNHKTHHRGCVAQIMRGVSLRTSSMDLSVFLREHGRMGNGEF